MSGFSILAALALVQAMLGPVRTPLSEGEPGQSLVLSLCGGGSVSIPLGQGQMPGQAMTMCCAKGCRNSSRRARIDPRQ